MPAPSSIGGHMGMDRHYIRRLYSQAVVDYHSSDHLSRFVQVLSPQHARVSCTLFV
jgi:hypothetical protein